MNPNNNDWAIMDSKGIIHTGTQEQMTTLFYNTVHDLDDAEHTKVDKWEGDLILIQIHNITR